MGSALGVGLGSEVCTGPLEVGVGDSSGLPAISSATTASTCRSQAVHREQEVKRLGAWPPPATLPPPVGRSVAWPPPASASPIHQMGIRRPTTGQVRRVPGSVQPQRRPKKVAVFTASQDTLPLPARRRSQAGSTRRPLPDSQKAREGPARQADQRPDPQAAVPPHPCRFPGPDRAE